MKIKKVRLNGFKRFDDLTIDLGDNPRRVIALVGPNGCGKSSVFDAFSEKSKDVKGGGVQDHTFFSKFIYSTDDELKKNASYDYNTSITIEFEGDNQQVSKESFLIRSPYRYTAELNLSQITAQPDVLDDQGRPTSSIALDQRLTQNYARLQAAQIDEWQNGTLSGPRMRQDKIGELNTILNKILDIKISSLGNVMDGKGQLYFQKGKSKDFPYKNLSSGEKEVIDIVLDFVVRKEKFNDTVYCIDEPELHLNSAIQRTLLVEIEKLVPENCQLWIATHSIGFLRALQTELSNKCAVLDFSEEDYFQSAKIIQPIEATRSNWQRIFATAIDDLVGLLSPKRIIYCEGRKEPGNQGEELGFDAQVYNEIFSLSHSDTIFVSSGGSGELPKYSSVAISIIQKAFLDVEVYLLRDRDLLTDNQRTVFVKQAPHHRMLFRHEIENYIFDPEVVENYMASQSPSEKFTFLPNALA